MRDKISERKGHQHRGKFTEGLLDKNLILKALKIKPGQTIVDAGCGNGYMSRLFSHEVTQSGRVYALDRDKYFIGILQEETRESNIEAMVGDITKPTGIKKSSVDLIYLSTVIHGFSKQQIKSFLNEVERLLRPDGVLAIVEIEKKQTSFGPPLNIRFSPDELKDVIPMSPLNTMQVGEHFYIQLFKRK